MTLALSHIAFFCASAWYLCAFFPAHGTMVVSLAAAGLAAELAAFKWRAYYIAEALLVGIGLLVYGRWHPEDREAWHSFIGMGMVCWLLVPSRFGWLRYLVPLAGLEMLFVGINRDGAISRSASMALVPLALAALAVDAWLMSASGARASMRHRAPRLGMLRWALIPAAIAAILGLGVGLTIAKDEGPKPRPNTGKKHGLGPRNLGSIIDLDGEAISKDPGIAARLNWETHRPPPGMVYLRALALPRIRCEGSRVTWEDDSESYTGIAIPTAATAATGFLYRAAGGGDVVFRPEGSSTLDLDGLLTNPEDNLFRLGFGESQHVYRVSLDSADRAVRADAGSTYRRVPGDLNSMPWERIEGRHDWRRYAPENAAAAVCRFLADHCEYRTQNLPKPANETGGALRTFLFASETERLGHCQYFASAAAILLRRAGHQARCVIGFASNERDDQGVVFRGMHAHAWIEVADSYGIWRRFDPTPAQSLSEQRDREIAAEVATTRPPDISPEDMKTAAEILKVAQERRHGRWRLFAYAVAALAAALIIWRWLRRARRDPRRLELERRADDLFRLASGLGISVTPATTVTMVAQTMSARTGIDLSPWLDAHLAARYGTGPIPEPWPIAQLREAAKRQRQR
ncbi:MAG: transglutaminase domain-containing protein [Planctomycetes bacterium]|nr:transglutaminase domain-containing protein [Planctomycetota bacterium]